NLWFAKFDVSTNCTATNFYSVAVQYVDFSDLMQFSEHLQDMFGDATVTLPDGQKIDSPDWPAHWPKFEMDRSTFHAEWRKWQDDPYGYVPPEPPMDAGGVLTD
ncbi:MAG: hypothetical protein P8L32_09190, partial [Paracoccaceae bacterium]|nr:hypothetical protein [Paracoccaceae bacterium]